MHALTLENKKLSPFVDFVIIRGLSPRRTHHGIKINDCNAHSHNFVLEETLTPTTREL